MKIFMTKIINNFFKTIDSTLITYINHIFLNHIHENNIRDNLDQITHLKIIMFIHKIQLKQIIINQHKCKMKCHYLNTYNNMKTQKHNNMSTYNFPQTPNAGESLQMTMNPYLMGGSSLTSNKPLMVFTGTDPE